MAFVILYLLATGRYLASRVKYDGSKQFLHRRQYISPQNNVSILCSMQVMRYFRNKTETVLFPDVIMDKVHYRIA